MLLFTYLLPMYSARRLMCAHVFDAVFVVRHGSHLCKIKYDIEAIRGRNAGNLQVVI
jgi:hypothetical protein